MNDGRFRFPLSAFRFSDKDRPGVARPAAIRRVCDEFYFPQIHTDALQNLAGVLFIFWVADEQEDFFADGNLADHFAIDPRDDREFPRPVRGVMRPSQPRCGVRFPFGGQSVAEIGGRDVGGGFQLQRKHSGCGIFGNAESCVRRAAPSFNANGNGRHSNRPDERDCRQLHQLANRCHRRRRRWRISSSAWSSRSADIWCQSSRMSGRGSRCRVRTSRNEIRKWAWLKIIGGPQSSSAFSRSRRFPASATASRWKRSGSNRTVSWP